MDQKEGSHENEFWAFSNSEMNVTNSYGGKSRSKTGVVRLAFMFPSGVMVLKLSKKVDFLVLVLARNLSLF